jgi:hypothetical protein
MRFFCCFMENEVVSLDRKIFKYYSRSSIQMRKFEMKHGL